MRLLFVVTAVVFLAPGFAFPQSDERLSFQAFSQDPKRVASLERGIAAMMDRDKKPRDSADYRRSWEFWAATHQYIPDGLPPNDPLRSGLFADQPTYTPPNLPKGVSDVVGRCEHGTLGFLPWHRWYLYYFERVLQEAAKDPTLRIPYWDYSDQEQGQLPAPFRLELYDPGDGRAENPLFASHRTLGMNDGFIQPAIPALGLKSSFRQGDFQSFSAGLEGSAHGVVHCAVGQGCRGPLMGTPETAAKDPIFWLHHANIDRFWQCWLTQHTMPKAGEDENWDEVMKAKYAFVDSDGSIVHVNAADNKKPYVKYDNEKCPELPALPTQPVGKSHVVWSGQAAGAAIHLGALPLEVEREIGASNAIKGVPTFKVQSAAPKRIHLRIDGARVEHAPGVIYEVRLKAPNSAAEDTVGAITFFGVGHHAAEGKKFRFDVTDSIKSLTGSLDPKSVIVRLVPSLGVTGLSADAPKKAFDESSNPTIGAIEFEVLQ